MKLDSLKDDLFTPLDESEIPRLRGGLAPGATGGVTWANCWLLDGTVLLERDDIPDAPEPAIATSTV